MTTTTHPDTTTHETTLEPHVRQVDLDTVTRALGKRSFCLLATVSPADRPHAAGVLYQAVGTTLYVSTDLTSRKARNIGHNSRVGVNIPVRRAPFGPPSLIQFQGTAEILENDDPEITRLVEAGRLKKITSHGELERPGTCMVRITPARRLNTYGLGMSLIQLIRHPLDAAGYVELPS